MKLVQGTTCLFAISIISLYVCPYCKVEESFNMQATHDLYHSGIAAAVQRFVPLLQPSATDNADAGPLEYDHLQYPGVVPRTFSGPLLLSSLSRTVTCLLHITALTPPQIEALHRLWLLLLNLHAHHRLARAINAKWNPTPANSRLGNYFLLTTAAQFHIPFYASRMLPNSFALLLVTHAYADWISARTPRALRLLVFAAAVVRCDVLLLLATIGLSLLLRRRLALGECLRLGLTVAGLALLATVPIDSVLWQRWTWPEGEVLWFNTVRGGSAAYGVSPWHWYFSAALPRAMLLTLGLVPMAFCGGGGGRGGGGGGGRGGLALRKDDHGAMVYFAPVFAFVALYSFLPHKEVRFVFVALPMFNCMAANGIHNLHTWAHDAWNTPKHEYDVVAMAKKHDTEESDHSDTGARSGSASKRVFYTLCFVGGLGAIVISCCGSLLFLAVSRENYPGGRALSVLTNAIEDRGPASGETIYVYIDVASAMTGAMSKSRILHLQNICSKNGVRACQVVKAGYEMQNSHKREEIQYDFLITEEGSVDGYQTLHAIQGHPRFDIRKLKVVTREAIFVLERTSDQNQ